MTLLCLIDTLLFFYQHSDILFFVCFLQAHLHNIIKNNLDCVHINSLFLIMPFYMFLLIYLYMGKVWNCCLLAIALLPFFIFASCPFKLLSKLLISHMRRLNFSMLLILCIICFFAGDFQLQCRVLNKPYDIFGTWYNDQYLLSGDLHWLAHLVSQNILVQICLSILNQSAINLKMFGFRKKQPVFNIFACKMCPVVSRRRFSMMTKNKI